MPFSLGFRQENARYLGFSLGKTQVFLHIRRFSYRFPEVFVRKTHVTLGFPRGNPIFLAYSTVFVPFS